MTNRRRIALKGTLWGVGVTAVACAVMPMFDCVPFLLAKILMALVNLVLMSGFLVWSLFFHDLLPGSPLPTCVLSFVVNGLLGFVIGLTVGGRKRR